MAIYFVNLGVNFILQKFCLCKKNDKYEVWLDLTIDNGIHVRGVTDPQEQIPMALSPRLIFCPSDTRNCPSFTASPTFCKVYLHCQQKIVCLCGPKIFGLLAPSVIGYKDWGDMLWVCLRLSVQRLTSFMTPVFVPPDRTQAFVALAAPIRPAFNDQIRSP